MKCMNFLTSKNRRRAKALENLEKIYEFQEKTRPKSIPPSMAHISLKTHIDKIKSKMKGEK